MTPALLQGFFIDQLHRQVFTSSLGSFFAKLFCSLREIGISNTSAFRDLIEFNSLAIGARHEETIPTTQNTLGTKLVQIRLI